MPPTSRLGGSDTLLGQVALGVIPTADAAPGVIPAQPALATRALAYVAHLYEHDGITFRQLLGKVMNRPALKQTYNSTGHDITLEFPAADSSAIAPGPGQIIKILEQGGDGSVVFTGFIEDTPELITVDGKVAHQVQVFPIGVELGDGSFNKNYTAATDVAQFVRDAVAKTDHLKVTPFSCPDTGILRTYNFNNATPADGLTVARQIAGKDYVWFIDGTGIVYFWPVNLAAPAAYTLKKGVDFSGRNKFGPTIRQLKNLIPVTGGLGALGLPLTSTYSNAVSQALYGVKKWDPGPTFPDVTSQATLDNIAATLGALFDRTVTKYELILPAFGQRIDFRRQGGATVRIWEPAVEAMKQSGAGSGGYSSTMLILDCETDGPAQKLICSDVAVSGLDEVQAEIDRQLQRSAAPTTQPQVIINAPNVLPAGGSIATASGTGFRALLDSLGWHMRDGSDVERIFFDALNARIKLFNSSGVERIRLDGQLARQMVLDAAGVVLAEWGDLAANGISPAQIGFRANDASGNPLLDNLGPISGGVMASLGIASVFVNTGGLTSTTYVAMPGTVSFNFTIANRKRNVMFLFLATCYITAGAGQIRVRCNLVSTTASGPLKFAGTGTTAISNGFGHLYVADLAAGSYTVQMEYQVDAGVTGFIDQSVVQGFQLGS